MLFCGVVHHFGTSGASLIAAFAMLGFVVGWMGYLVRFWRFMHERPATVAEDEAELAA
jgi:hypothetical protein